MQRAWVISSIEDNNNKGTMMRIVGRVCSVVVTSILCLALVAGCHGSGGGTQTTKWVNAANASQVLELKFREVSILTKAHASVFPMKFKGTYVLKNGDDTTEGKVTQDGGSFILTLKDGKEEQFQRESSTLKDSSGGIWKQSNPTTTATLREY
jgi:hypothetical protein